MINIIKSTIALNQACLSKEEQEEVYNFLVKHKKKTFSLTDAMGTWSNIEVDLQIIDKSAFAIGTIYVKEDDKPMIYIEMQR